MVADIAVVGRSLELAFEIYYLVVVAVAVAVAVAQVAA